MGRGLARLRQGYGEASPFRQWWWYWPCRAGGAAWDRKGDWRWIQGGWWLWDSLVSAFPWPACHRRDHVGPGFQWL